MPTFPEGKMVIFLDAAVELLSAVPKFKLDDRSVSVAFIFSELINATGMSRRALTPV